MIYVSASVFGVLYAILLCIVGKLYYNYYHECEEMKKNADSDKEWPLVHKLMGRNVADMRSPSTRNSKIPTSVDYTVTEQRRRESKLVQSSKAMAGVDDSRLIEDHSNSFDQDGVYGQKDGQNAENRFIKNKLGKDEQEEFNFASQTQRLGTNDLY